jgi:hypothetical protein
LSLLDQDSYRLCDSLRCDVQIKDQVFVVRHGKALGCGYRGA